MLFVANAEAVSTFSAIAPITKSRGKSFTHRLRYACAKFLRQSFHEFAAASIPHSAWAKAFYDSQRARNKGHHTAVRRPRLQMDPHPLCLLEITNPIQRISLSPIPQKPPRSNRPMLVNKSAFSHLQTTSDSLPGTRSPVHKAPESAFYQFDGN